MDRDFDKLEDLPQEEKRSVRRRSLRESAHTDFNKLEDLPQEEKRDVRKRSQVEKNLAHAHRQEDLEGKRQDRAERKRYASLIYRLICGWLFAVLLLLFGEGQSWFHFELSDGVLLAVVAGTTANVLGIFWLVTNYLFPKGKGGN